MDPIGRTVLADAQKPGRSFLHSLGTRLLRNQDSGCAGPSFFDMESEGGYPCHAEEAAHSSYTQPPVGISDNLKKFRSTPLFFAMESEGTFLAEHRDKYTQTILCAAFPFQSTVEWHSQDVPR